MNKKKLSPAEPGAAEAGISTRWFYRFLIYAVVVTALLGACAPIQPAQPPAMPGNEQEVWLQTPLAVADHPALRRADGQTFLLLDDEDLQNPDWFVPQAVEVSLRQICSRPPFPASVNLQANQTPIRNQGGRDTCTVFAITAAIEAAYRRQYGLTLDLSEQYLNHVQKAFWLNRSALTPLVEIQPETNGGGNLPWQAAVLERYGLPEESALPYIDSGDYQDTNQPGDRPSGLDSPTLTQRELDDFNLSPTLETYAIPGELTTVVFPQPALEGGRYRPTQVSFANDSDRGNLDWYRSQLACGYEIMFQVNLNSGPDNTNDRGVWIPGTGNPFGSHAMLIVGYDDSLDALLVKNSWGGEALNWFSYDWVRSGFLTDAGVILDVADPNGPFGVWENKQLFLGRWNLNHDGWRGVLDIYRLPGPSGGPLDLRVGTYFGPDGVARRVNATIEGNRIEFTIDWDNPNQPADVMQGLRFTGYLFSWNHQLLAGTMVDNRDGNSYGFHAQKALPWSGVPATASLGLDSYVGLWQMEHDGWQGFLTIRGVDPTSRVVHAVYESIDGRQYNVNGRIGQDPRRFTLNIAFGSPPQPFSGLLYGREFSLAAGTTTWAGTPFGFAMVRVGDAASVIPTPTETPEDVEDDTPLVCAKKPYLPQCQ